MKIERFFFVPVLREGWKWLSFLSVIQHCIGLETWWAKRYERTARPACFCRSRNLYALERWMQKQRDTPKFVS